MYFFRRFTLKGQKDTQLVLVKINLEDSELTPQNVDGGYTEYIIRENETSHNDNRYLNTLFSQCINQSPNKKYKSE